MRVMGWVLVLVCVVSAAGCAGPDAKKAKYRARAQQYIQEKNWAKARVELRNALKIDPKDSESYFLVGTVEENEGNWRNALGDYLKVVNLVPHHREARIKLGRFYVAAGKSDLAQDVVNGVLADYPGDPTAETLSVAILARAGRMGDAVAKAEAVRNANPTDAEVAAVLAALYTSENRGHEAEAELRRALALHPRDVSLLNALGETLLKQDRRDDAKQIFKRMVEIEPDVFEHRIKVARVSTDFAEGEAVLREAIRLDPKDEQRRLVLAEYLATRVKDPQKAEAVLVDARRDLPRATQIPFVLGKFYEAAHRFSDARALYEDIAKTKSDRPQGLEAQAKLASLDLAEGSSEKAEKRLAEVLDQNPRAADALMLRAKIALARGDAIDAVQDLRTVLRDQPDLVEAHALLGQAHVSLGEEALARESLEKAAALDPHRAEVRRTLARLDLAEGHPKEARERLEAILNTTPNDVESLRGLLDVNISERNWPQVERTLVRLRDADNVPGSFAMTEGRVRQVRKQYDQARAAYERANSAAPDALEPLVALTQLDLSTGKSEQAKARLVRLIAARPGHPYAHGIVGSVLLAEKDQQAAEREWREATKIKPDWLVPWINLASLKAGQQRRTEAATVLQTGLTANPRSEQLRLLLAGVLSDDGRTDQAIAEYETILQQNPKSAVAANNLAVLLTDRKGDSKSLVRALALTKDFERTASNPMFLDTLGWVYTKLGQSDDAVRLLKPAAEKAPGEPVVNYHLGMAYHQAGDKKQAKVYLAKALETGRAFSGADEARTALAAIP